MRRFAELIDQLDQTTKTNQRVEYLVNYLDQAEDGDKVWATALLTGKRPRRSVKTSLLRDWAAENADIPSWLLEESYHVVGDLAETISLVLPEDAQGPTNQRGLSHWVETLVTLKDAEDDDKKQVIVEAWKHFSRTERFVFNKLMTGGFRIGVSAKLMTRAIALHTGQEENVITHKLMGKWDPQSVTFQELVFDGVEKAHQSKPYPFYLAYALEGEVSDLGKPKDWSAERKWDGIRGQLIIRGGNLYVWTRGEELATEKFPEFFDFPNALPDGLVLDGEILVFADGAPLDFNVLQTRIGRKNVSKNILKNAPVSFYAYDLLEFCGKDLREEPFDQRRKMLEEVVTEARHNRLLLSPIVEFESWDQLTKEREKSRELSCEGIMLKRKTSVYGTGRRRGDWWKWKIDPYTVDAVLIYAMRGHGRRANLYTDYTFAVWDGDTLVPFTKAYSGLTDAEFLEVDRFVKRNTLERFGPVRSVKPELVFEIHFEGIARSTRHKSGIALRFPRMHRWRKDKKAAEANTIEDLYRIL